MRGRAVQGLNEGPPEGFDDHHPCRGEGGACRLEDVENWLSLFTLQKNPGYLRIIELAKEVISLK